MDKRVLIRVSVAVFILVNLAYLSFSYADAETGAGEVLRSDVAPRDGITVITTQHFARTIRTAEIVAYGPSGELLYYNDSHTSYFDVDPVPGTRASVSYVATDPLNRSVCHGKGCNRIVLERVNLTTGATEVLYETTATGRHHDIDRIDENRYVVADIARDSVYIVNIRTGIVKWMWSAELQYSHRSGGQFPDDWTHLNDVEFLEDGRILASIRNQDQVVFLDRREGVIEAWTLGCEDCHEVLYEQHNPDYINPSKGGPAILVADSENNRVVEYQRRDGDWERTWLWADDHLDWPRDADRLPDGNTLITDSRGDRVIEVAPNGTVVWSVDIGLPYEAERLNSGPESQHGPSADAAGIESREARGDADVDTTAATIRRAVKSMFPTEFEKALIFVLPGWIHFYELVALLGALLAFVGWIGLEIRWSPYALSISNPIELTK